MFSALKRVNGAEPILTKCNEAETIKGQSLFQVSAMKQKQ